jgi:cardiolipin synthase
LTKKKKKNGEQHEKEHVGVWTKRGTTYIHMPLVAFIAVVFAVVALTILLWSVKQRPDTHLQVKNPGNLPVLLPSIVGLTQSTLDGGNRVQVLQNGDEFFPALMSAIDSAKESVHIETFIWWEGKICEDLVQLLTAKARQGVEVRLLVDASGGKKLTEQQETLIEAAGGMVGRFHPVRLSTLGRLNNRDHRKIMVIDGRIGFLGGFGIAEEWTGNAQDRDHWRDTGLRVEGPVVNRIQAAFSENWIEATGEIPAGVKYFPVLPAVGATRAHVAYTSPTGTISSVQLLHYLAIAAARKEIIIQNPYLLPDSDALQALEDAVRRGVDVKIMVPSDDATDNAIVQHASHHHFGTLMKAGVKIWEYDKTLLHQKVIVVDGIWSGVGSTNFDDRSFQLNDEITIGILDEEIAAELKEAFQADLRHARQRNFEEWSKRSLWHKLVDGIAYLGHEQL